MHEGGEEKLRKVTKRILTPTIFLFMIIADFGFWRDKTKQAKIIFKVITWVDVSTI
jgi:hypothetical protein